MSRQYVEMTRIRIEGLLAAFPKLMGSGNKQHTFVETESVRYVYQPMENLFLLMITTKNSNIVQDLDTLRLLSKVVPEVAEGLTEECVSKKCFELVFAFDEVINAGGYKEDITLAQIKTNMEMESHEEKLHLMIKQSKIDTAKEEMKRKAVAIKEAQREQSKSGMDSISSGFGGGGDSAAAAGGETPEEVQSSSSAFEATSRAEPAPVHKPKIEKKGMALGKKGKGMNLMGAMADEEGMDLAAIAAPAPAAATTKAAAPPPPVSNDPVTLVIEEKLSVSMNREGAMESMEVKGSLGLTVNDESAASCTVPLTVGANDGFVFQTHPKVDKKKWASEKAISLKDAKKGFPTGNKVGVLRWTYKPSDETEVPLTINCWPEEEGDGNMNVNIEYTLENTDMELRDVNIEIPLGTDAAPTIVSVDGDHKHNGREGIMMWHLDMIDESNASGTLEFTIPGDDADSFFPLNIGFYSPKLFVDLKVDGCNTSDGEAIRHGYSASLVSDTYTVA